jgi:hypothetical protein
VASEADLQEVDEEQPQLDSECQQQTLLSYASFSRCFP